MTYLPQHNPDELPALRLGSSRVNLTVFVYLDEEDVVHVTVDTEDLPPTVPLQVYVNNDLVWRD